MYSFFSSPIFFLVYFIHFTVESSGELLSFFSFAFYYFIGSPIGIMSFPSFFYSLIGSASDILLLSSRFYSLTCFSAIYSAFEFRILNEDSSVTIFSCFSPLISSLGIFKSSSNFLHLHYPWSLYLKMKNLLRIRTYSRN